MRGPPSKDSEETNGAWPFSSSVPDSRPDDAMASVETGAASSTRTASRSSAFTRSSSPNSRTVLLSPVRSTSIRNSCGRLSSSIVADPLPSVCPFSRTAHATARPLRAPTPRPPATPPPGSPPPLAPPVGADEDPQLRMPTVREIVVGLQVVAAGLTLLLARGVPAQHRVVRHVTELDREFLVDLLRFGLGDDVIGHGVNVARAVRPPRLRSEPGARWLRRPRLRSRRSCSGAAPERARRGSRAL